MATIERGDENLPTVGIRDTSLFTDLTLLNINLVNLRLCHTGSEETAYFVSNSSWNSKFNPDTPDVIVHNGPDKEAPVVAVGHLTISGTNTVGVGDYSKGDVRNAMVWEKLQRISKWTHATYQYEFSFGNGIETRTMFEWRRVKKSLSGAYCLQLVELSNPDVVLGAFIPDRE